MQVLERKLNPVSCIRRYWWVLCELFLVSFNSRQKASKCFCLAYLQLASGSGKLSVKGFCCGCSGKNYLVIQDRDLNNIKNQSQGNKSKSTFRWVRMVREKDPCWPLRYVKVSLNVNKNRSNIVLQVNRDTDFDKVGMSHRIIWAPCLLVPVDDQQPMLAISFGSKAEVYNLNKIVTNHSNCVLNKSKLTDGVINVDIAHSKVGTCQVLSFDNLKNN